MKVKTINKINVYDKPKVLFISHPGDFAQYFELLSNDILSNNDCAIYYYEPDQNILFQEWETDLMEMNLIVFPITNSFLSEQNIAMDIYLFTQDKSTPILPIMVEKRLDQKFNDACGQKQYLDRTDNDPTSIPYAKKLKDYLSVVLIDDDTSKKARTAFNAHVFLSYRQKDRKYAQTLMRAIHNNKYTSSIAIWYDEFLQPGENFNYSIKLAIQKSDLFALAITPNLVNESNYVITDEYPAALSYQKHILPVELINTDKKLLHGYFPNLPNCIDINDTAALSAALFKALPQIAKQTHPINPINNYYLGLAYLHGVDVEIDREKGIEFISSAAKCGILDAVKDLVKMYYYGFFVSIDFSKAIYWQEKLVGILSEQYSNIPSSNNAFDYADALRFLTEIERKSTSDNKKIDKMITHCKKALDLCENVTLDNEEALSRYAECKMNTLRSLAILYEISGNFEEAIVTYNMSLSMRKIITEADKSLNCSKTEIENEFRQAQLHHDIGTLFCKKGDYRTAVIEFLKSIKIYRELSDITPDFLPNEASVHEALSYAATFFDISLSEKHSTIALEICKGLVDKNASLYELRYASALLNRAFVLTELSSTDFDEIERLCTEAEKIFETHITSASHEISFNYVNVLYKLAGTNRKKFNLIKAGQYYEKALNAAESFLSISSPDDKWVIANLYFDYGTFLSINANKDKLIKAIEYLHNALTLFENDGSRALNYIGETKSIIAVLEKHLNSINDSIENFKIENDNEVYKTYSNFIDFLGRAEEAENLGNYQKAVLAYNSSLEQLAILEKNKGEVDALSKAVIFERLAYCCEMIHDLDGAKKYSAKAEELASKPAKRTCEPDAAKVCKHYLEKIITFLKSLMVRILKK